MADKMEEYIERCARRLEANGFHVALAGNLGQAHDIIAGIIDADRPRIISYGDSMTLLATGILDTVRGMERVEFIDGFEKGIERPVLLERRRRALMSDLFLTGVNGVSVEGSLHWLDMVGNRIAPIAYGPRRVVLIAGSNKIRESEQEALRRIREIAAPLNAARHEGFNTPCVHTGRCHDCSSPQRICNASLNLYKCFPQGRITVILVEEAAGL